MLLAEPVETGFELKPTDVEAADPEGEGLGLGEGDSSGEGVVVELGEGNETKFGASCCLLVIFGFD